MKNGLIEKNEMSGELDAQNALTKLIQNLKFKQQYYHSFPWEDTEIDLEFSRAMAYLRAFKDIQDVDNLKELRVEFFNLNAASLIYFSNRIEDSGLPETETFKLCMKKLNGKIPSPDKDFEIGSDISSPKFINNSRNQKEVIQHMESFTYLKDRIVDQKKVLSEPIIKNAHRLLMTGMNREDGEYAEPGNYRTTPCFAGHQAFLGPSYIPVAMGELLKQYEIRVSDLKGENKDGEDPFYLAAWLSYQFVTIHPFVDGNGRMCRMLLNVVLLSVGIPLPTALGFSCGHKRARQHYIQCLKEATKKNCNPKRLATVVLFSFTSVAANFFAAVKVGYYPESTLRVTDE